MRVSHTTRIKNIRAYLDEMFSLAKDNKAFYPSKLAKRHHISSYIFQAVVDMNLLVAYRESAHSLVRIDWTCGKIPDDDMAEMIGAKVYMLAAHKPHSKKPFPDKPVKQPKPKKMKIWVNGVAVNIARSDSLDIEVNNVHSVIRLLDQ